MIEAISIAVTPILKTLQKSKISAKKRKGEIKLDVYCIFNAPMPLTKDTNIAPNVMVRK